MVFTAADRREPFNHRNLTTIIETPAQGGAIQSEGTSMFPAATDGGELLIRLRRRRLAHSVTPPAYRGVVGS